MIYSKALGGSGAVVLFVNICCLVIKAAQFRQASAQSSCQTETAGRYRGKRARKSGVNHRFSYTRGTLIPQKVLRERRKYE